MKTGKNTATIKGRRATLRSLAYSPDGKTLASGGGDRAVKLWDVKTGKNTATFRVGPLGPSELRSVVFSPDGKTLASGAGVEDEWVEERFVRVGIVKLWDVKTGKEGATLRGHTEPVWSVAFSPDGKILASGGVDGKVKLWDVSTGKNVHAQRTHGACLRGVQPGRQDARLGGLGRSGQAVGLLPPYGTGGSSRAALRPVSGRAPPGHGKYYEMPPGESARGRGGGNMRSWMALAAVGTFAGLVLGVLLHTGTPFFGLDTPSYMAAVLGTLGAAVGATVCGLLESPSGRARAVSKWCVGMAAVVGGTGFMAGFLGPILLEPASPQGPLFGVFVTGPFSCVVGGMIGTLVGAVVPLPFESVKSHGDELRHGRGTS